MKENCDMSRYNILEVLCRPMRCDAVDTLKWYELQRGALLFYHTPTILQYGDTYYRSLLLENEVDCEPREQSSQ